MSIPSNVEVGFSLGSNLGERLQHLITARRALLALPGVEELAASPVYETEPVDVPEQFGELKYLNCVLILRASLSPEKWLKECKRIEYMEGRRRSDERNAPRPIDVDLLYAGDVLMNERDLVLPHPRWAQREFVVRPLAEVRPDLILPGTELRVSCLRDQLAGSGGLHLFSATWD